MTHVYETLSLHSIEINQPWFHDAPKILHIYTASSMHSKITRVGIVPWMLRTIHLVVSGKHDHK